MSTTPRPTGEGTTVADASTQAAEEPEAEDAAATDGLTDRTDRDTGHWRGVGAVVLLLGGAGVVTGTPALLLAAAVGVGYLAYARLFTYPTPSLRIERSVDDTSPDPGDAVTVTVTVHNEGDSLLPDLRLVDGVPAALTVVAGSARHATALPSGDSVTFRYDVLAKRGVHTFAGTTVLARDPSGARETEFRVDSEATVTCTPSLDTTLSVPLRPLTSRYVGRVDTQSGGEGIEFFSTRQYRPGDSLSQIDWNRRARTGELTTLQFREEQAATVVLLLDLREEAYVSHDRDGLHAADRSVDAAGKLFSSLLETGERAGIAALSPEDVWLAPGTGNDHRARARELLATHPALSSTPPERYFSTTLRVRKLRKRMPPDAQILLLSPFVDEPVARVARLLDAHGHLVTCVSPDPTANDTPGRALARAERSNRLASLRQAGIRVVDWAPDETVTTALARAERGWRS